MDILIFSNRIGLQWSGPVSLAIDLVNMKCSLGVLCAPQSNLLFINGLSDRYVYDPARINNIGDLEIIFLKIIKERKNFIILPGDEIALRLLHQLFRATQKESVLKLLENSLTEADSFDELVSDIVFAQKNNSYLPCFPPYQIFSSLDHFCSVECELEFPLVCKFDRTWGGLGVYFAKNKSDLIEHVRTRPPNSPFILKKIVHGEEYGVCISAVKGMDISFFIYKKIVTSYLAGPVTVIQLVEDAKYQKILQDIFSVLEKIKFTGFGNFDFIEDKEGEFWLLEFNARVHPVSHLGKYANKNIINHWLLKQFPNQKFGNHSEINLKEKLISLFPGEVIRNPKSQYLKNTYHDVPWGEPLLLSNIISRLIRRNSSNLKD